MLPDCFSGAERCPAWHCEALLQKGVGPCPARYFRICCFESQPLAGDKIQENCDPGRVDGWAQTSWGQGSNENWDTEEIVHFSMRASWTAKLWVSLPGARGWGNAIFHTPSPSTAWNTAPPVEAGVTYTKPCPSAPHGASLLGQVCEPAQWTSPSEDQHRPPIWTKSPDHGILQSISFS